MKIEKLILLIAASLAIFVLIVVALWLYLPSQHNHIALNGNNSLASSRFNEKLYLDPELDITNDNTASIKPVVVGDWLNNQFHALSNHQSSRLVNIAFSKKRYFFVQGVANSDQGNEFWLVIGAIQNSDWSDQRIAEMKVNFSEGGTLKLIESTSKKVPNQLSNLMANYDEKWRDAVYCGFVLHGSLDSILQDNQSIELIWPNGNDVLPIEQLLIIDISFIEGDLVTEKKL